MKLGLVTSAMATATKWWYHAPAKDFQKLQQADVNLNVHSAQCRHSNWQYSCLYRPYYPMFHPSPSPQATQGLEWLPSHHNIVKSTCIYPS